MNKALMSKREWKKEKIKEKKIIKGKKMTKSCLYNELQLKMCSKLEKKNEKNSWKLEKKKLDADKMRERPSVSKKKMKCHRKW